MIQNKIKLRIKLKIQLFLTFWNFQLKQSINNYTFVNLKNKHLNYKFSSFEVF